MATRPTIYLTTLISPLTKFAGEDCLDGTDLNKMIKHWASIVKINNTDSPFTLLATDAIIHADSTSGSITVNLLPAAQCAGMVRYVHKVAAGNNLTIDADGSENINDSTTLVLTAKDSWAMLTCDGTQWKAAVAGAGGGGGSTGSNVNTEGIGVFDGLVVSDLQFRGIKGLGALSAALNATTKAIELSLTPGSIDRNTLGGSALTVATGGTGSTTTVDAFDTLSPLSTLGDVLAHDGADNKRIAGNTAALNKFLRSTGNGTISAMPSFESLVAADLPAEAFRKDQDNNIGAHYFDIQEIAAPGTPPANTARSYVDSADSRFKVKKDDGSVVDLESSAGASETYREVSSTGTLLASDRTVKVKGSATSIQTLPQLSGVTAGARLMVANKTVTDFAVTIRPFAGDTINGSSADRVLSLTHDIILLHAASDGDWIMVA